MDNTDIKTGTDREAPSSTENNAHSSVEPESMNVGHQLSDTIQGEPLGLGNSSDTVLTIPAPAAFTPLDSSNDLHKLPLYRQDIATPQAQETVVIQRETGRNSSSQDPKSFGGYLTWTVLFLIALGLQVAVHLQITLLHTKFPTPTKSICIWSEIIIASILDLVCVVMLIPARGSPLVLGSAALATSLTYAGVSIGKQFANGLLYSWSFILLTGTALLCLVAYVVHKEKRRSLRSGSAVSTRS